MTAASRLELKAFENQLDAVLCAWIAVCALDGRAAPLGDQASAILIPSLKIAFREQRSFAVDVTASGNIEASPQQFSSFKAVELRMIGPQRSVSA
jgi:hypothetical protein